MFLALLALALAPSAHAGIVNVQPVLSAEEEEGWSTEITGSLNANTGNVSSFIARGGALVRYQVGDHRFTSSSNAQIGFSGGNEFLNSAVTHLRHQAALSERVEWETYLQASRNPYRRLYRGLAGTGPRWAFVDTEEAELAAAVSYLFELQRFTVGDYPDSGEVQRNHRASTYLTGTLSLDPAVTLVHTTYFQPRLDDPTDYRLLSQSSVGFKVTESLAFRVEFSLAYYTSPPAGVERLDSSTNLGLTLSL